MFQFVALEKSVHLCRDFRASWSSFPRSDPCSTIQIRVYNVTDSVEFMSPAGKLAASLPRLERPRGNPVRPEQKS